MFEFLLILLESSDHVHKPRQLGLELVLAFCQLVFILLLPDPALVCMLSVFFPAATTFARLHLARLAFAEGLYSPYVRPVGPWRIVRVHVRGNRLFMPTVNKLAEACLVTLLTRTSVVGNGTTSV